jgi:SAM-dependent methyltransferase
MTATNPQAALWNGHSGHAWVEAQVTLDSMFQPLEALLLEAVRASTPRHVLDIGCGTGGTTLAIAQALGAAGQTIGLDISEPMIALARSRAERESSSARFVCADAQRYPLAPASVDMIVSRFGVMFFDDPVQAFANLRRTARDNAELRVIAWRSAADNPFMTVAEREAASLLPALPSRQPGAPGPFAFADRERVTALLAASGWSDITIHPIDVLCRFPERELVNYFTRLGPVGQVLRDTDTALRQRVIEVVRPAFDPYVFGSEVRYTAACWTIGAHAA